MLAVFINHDSIRKFSKHLLSTVGTSFLALTFNHTDIIRYQY